MAKISIYISKMRIDYHRNPSVATKSLGLYQYQAEDLGLHQHGIMQGGYHACARDFELGRERHPWHWLVWTLDGQGEYRVRENGVEKKGQIKPHSLWVFPETVPYHLRPQQTRSEWNMLWWSLSPDIYHLGEQARELHAKEFFKHFVHAFMGLLEENASLVGERHNTVRAYSELLATYCRRQFSETGKAPNTALEKIRRAVDKDPGKDWQLEGLAEMAHLSPSQLVRRMKQEYQCTPMQLVTRIRMRHAERLLMRDDLSLDAIADRLGYQNGFALSKAFKRVSGVSPKYYREMVKD